VLDPNSYGPDAAVVSLEEATDREDELLMWCGHRPRRHAPHARPLQPPVPHRKQFRSAYPEAGDQLVCLANDHARALLNGAIWTARPTRGRSATTSLEMLVRSEDDGPRWQGACSSSSAGITTSSALEDELQKLPWARRAERARFAYGYALTVHKSQGSEWPRVVVVDESGAFREHPAQWLYTAVTRASKNLVLVRR
jgi:exodeoxyribonuclease-5